MCTFVITVERNAPLPFSLHVGPHPELQERKEEARQRAQEIHHSKVGVGVLIHCSSLWCSACGYQTPYPKGERASGTVAIRNRRNFSNVVEYYMIVLWCWLASSSDLLHLRFDCLQYVKRREKAGNLSA